MPCASLDGYTASISGFIAAQPEQSIFFAPFANMPLDKPVVYAQLAGEAKQVITELVNPAYARYHDFFVNEYQPVCRDSVGLAELPGGRELYDHFIRFFTTLDTNADAVHAVGLAEVARIREEMQTIIDGLAFEGEFDDFLHLLRTDPQFYSRDIDSYVAAAAAVAKQVDGKLPEYFANLPRNPYGISRETTGLVPCACK